MTQTTPLDLGDLAADPRGDPRGCSPPAFFECRPWLDRRFGDNSRRLAWVIIVITRMWRQVVVVRAQTRFDGAPHAARHGTGENGHIGTIRHLIGAGALLGAGLTVRPYGPGRVVGAVLPPPGRRRGPPPAPRPNMPGDRIRVARPAPGGHVPGPQLPHPLRRPGCRG